MNCPHCGTALAGRTRFVITGSLLIVGALLLLLFVRLPVTVLAALLAAVIGASMARGGVHARRCPRCGK